jgi:opacity protein-like surface antigen
MHIRSTLVLATVLFATTLAGSASAQGFVSGFIGTAFSKPALVACSITSGCEDGQRTYGFAIGGLGNVFGFELDYGYTKAFFGEIADATTDASSGMTTIMGNVMIAPKISFVQPYVLGGLGVMRLHVDSLTSTFTENDETKLAWDIGGGIIVYFGRNVGIRGDIRHIRGMQDLEVLAVNIDGSTIRFNRAAAALVVKF